MSIEAAKNVLLGVAVYIERIFFLFSGVLKNVGFYWIVVATIFSVAVCRLIVFPILGGKSFDLGVDKVRRSRRNTSKGDK